MIIHKTIECPIVNGEVETGNLDRCIADGWKIEGFPSVFTDSDGEQIVTFGMVKEVSNDS